MLEQKHEIFNGVKYSNLIETAALRQKRIKSTSESSAIAQLLKKINELHNFEENFIVSLFIELEASFLRSDSDTLSSAKDVKQVLNDNFVLKDFLGTIYKYFEPFYNEVIKDSNDQFEFDLTNENAVNLFVQLEKFIRPGIGLEYLESIKYLLATLPSSEFQKNHEDIIYFSITTVQFLIDLECLWPAAHESIQNQLKDESKTR